MKINRKSTVLTIFLIIFLTQGNISGNSSIENKINVETLNNNLKTNVSISSPKTQSSNSREAYALLVGVENYPGTDMDLQYTMDDVVDMNIFLQSEFDIPTQNIQILSDSEATEANILSTLSTYANIVDENDYFLFYYSGHGTASITDPLSYPHSISSPHPYPNDYDRYWYINHPGAAAIRVHFTRIDTEYGYDGIFVGDGYMTEYCYDIITGSYSDVWSSWVMSDNIYIELYTDYSYTDWGFAIDKYEIISYTDPFGLYPYSSEDIMLTGSELKETLDDVGGTQICIFDTCHSGGVGSDLVGLNRLVLCASEATEYSMEDPNLENGIFTNKFIESWNSTSDSNQDGIISFEEVFEECYSKVVSWSDQMGYAYHPQKFDGISGEVSFSPSIEIIDISFDPMNQQILCSGNYVGLGTFSMELTYYDFESQSFETISVDDPQFNSQFQFTDVILDINSVIPNSEIDYIFVNWLVEHNHESDSDLISIPLNSEMIISEIAAGISGNFPDYDSDGIPDMLEVIMNYDPRLVDSDSDGILDGEEDVDNDGLINQLEIEFGTNILLSDTDGDGFSDGIEVEKKTDPCNKTNNPTTRAIIWFGILAGFVSIASIYWSKKGKYIHQDRREAKQREFDLQKKIKTINDALYQIRRSSNSSHLQSQIKRLKSAYALDDPSILLDGYVIQNCTLLNKFYPPSIESCRDSKWVWYNSHFNDPNIFTRNDPLLVMAAPFANTLTNELQLFNKHYLPFSISNLRTVIGIAKAKYELFQVEEEEIYSEKSRYLEVLTQKPNFILSSHIETGKYVKDYSDFVKKLENYWSENKYVSLYSLIHSQDHKKGINYSHLMVLAWNSQLSLNDDFFKEILLEKYHNIDTLGELMEKVIQENPTISDAYLKNFEISLTQRKQFQQSKDDKSMLELIGENIALDPLVLQDWLDLGSIYGLKNEKEKEKLCYRVALAINPYAQEIWGSLLPPKAKPVYHPTPVRRTTNAYSQPRYSSSPNYGFSSNSRGYGNKYLPNWLQSGQINAQIASLAHQMFVGRVNAYPYLSAEAKLNKAMQDVVVMFLERLPLLDSNITLRMIQQNIQFYANTLMLRIPDMIAYVVTGRVIQETSNSQRPINRAPISKPEYKKQQPKIDKNQNGKMEDFKLGFSTLSLEEVSMRYRQLVQSGVQKYEIFNRLTSWVQKATSARGESIPYPKIFHKIKTFVNLQ